MTTGLADRAVSLRRRPVVQHARSAATGSSPPWSASGFGPNWPAGCSDTWRPPRQGRSIPAQDAEPGKILHETRNGEMAALGEMPFGRYYGSVDATPLFVLLAGAYYERSARPVVRRDDLAARRGRSRVDRLYGDRDGDGFVEYQSRATDGLIHQGWKDSDDAVSHADGTSAGGPIALCEVQGYVYAARRAGAVLAAALGMPDRAIELEASGESNSASGSRRCSGATTWIPTPWPWTATNGPAGFGPPTPAIAYSAASPPPSEPSGSRAA